jgi:Xaa-Pro aminopeptidase
MAVMQRALRPGVTEQELWAHLHAENIKRGGEWIETRLLSSGPRTNPWFQECGSRVIEAGDLVGFDTDLIGPYGYCADISRTWLCGERASAAQIDLYRLAREQVAHNLALIRPGVGFRELSERAFRLPERYRANRYSVVAHGVGLCDEYPAIYYPEDVAQSGYDGVLEANMTICIESYVGEAGGPEGVKLEQQLLITATGAEVISAYPFEDAVLG